MDKLIRLVDIPLDVLNDIGETLRFYSIAFTGVDEKRGRPLLLGSGVLVSAGGVKAILTAAHVVEVLPTKGRLGIFMKPGAGFESIDMSGVQAVQIARGRSDADGPDLGAVILAPAISSAIAARKSFLNLDARRDSVLQNPPDVHDGPWFAQGYLEEESVVERSPGAIDFYLYNLTGIGAPDVVVSTVGHDYVDFLVDHDARDTMPKDWGGMSGGGLWQVRLREEADRIVPGRPTLAGILFYQYPTSDDRCGVKGHAWRSIYDVAFTAIAQFKP